MKHREFYERHAYQMSLTALLIIAGLEIANERFSFYLPHILIFFFGMVCVTAVRIADIYKKQPLLYLLTGLAAMLIFVVVLCKKEALVSWFGSYLSWIKGRSQENVVEHETWYMVLSILSLGVMGAIPCYCLQKWEKTRRITAMGIVFLLIVYGVLEETVSSTGIALLVCDISIVVCEWIRHKDRKGREPVVVLHLFPVFFLYLILLMAVPTADHPMEWNGVRNLIRSIRQAGQTIYDKIQESIDDSYGEYEVLQVGYSESGSIGGSIEDDDDVALEVKATEGQIPVLYLKGNMKNQYTGSGWEESTQESVGSDSYYEYQIDTFELLYSLYRFDRFDTVKNKIRKNSVEVTYKDISTRSLFLPAKANQILLDGLRQNDESRWNTRFVDIQRGGSTYQVYFWQINYGLEEFEDWIHAEGGYLYQENRMLEGQEKGELYLPNNIESILAKHAESIRKEFLALPVSCPNRVKELTKTITEEKETVYDKLKAIEEYLHTYTYTTTPPSVPSDQDMVDYFLFESQKGYCTHFASAMAVMARTIGIPSRYVQGFIVDANEGGVMTVMNRQAHAWMEAYIEGVGWIAFEPTASYSDSRYTSWQPDSEVNEEENQRTKEQKKVLEELQEQRSDELAAQVKKEASRKEAYGDIVKITVMVMGILLLIFLLYIVESMRREKKRYQQSDFEQKIESDITQILFLLSKLARKIQDGETWSQYMKWVSQKYNKECLDFQEVATIYERLRYEEASMTKDEQTIVYDARIMLENEWKKQWGRLSYLRFCVKKDFKNKLKK